MKVLKFGGTSVGSLEGLLNVKEIVSRGNEAQIVIVSAFSAVTDNLINAAKLASEADSTYMECLDQLRERHYSVARALFPSEDGVGLEMQLRSLLSSLADALHAIFRERTLSEDALCEVVSYGERLSSLIISRLIEGATLHDSLRLIKTCRKGGRNFPDMEVTSALLKEEFSCFESGCGQGNVVVHSSAEGKSNGYPVAVLPGFISTDRDSGRITNLGRGGSDYTASIVASVMDAEVLEIWTDVDGFMTADPRIIKTSYVIGELSYREAMELCNFGAKVIYPPTLYPVRSKGIPLRIKNTFHPDLEGTIIKETCTHDKPITGITSIDDICLLTLSANSMVGVIGIDGRIFGTMAANDISVFLICQSSSETGITIGVERRNAVRALELLGKEFEHEIALGFINPIDMKESLASVAVVGDNMNHNPGLSGKVFSTLGRNGINVIAYTQGSDETNISFVVESRFLRKSLNVIHDSFFLSECQELNLFVCGVGTVGGKLLEQIASQREKLRTERNLKLNVVGIIRHHKGVFDRNGLDLSCWKELVEGGVDMTPERLVDEVVGMNIFNSVFVDCTASKDIADLYGTLFEHGVSVVAANKIAASSGYGLYRSLKNSSLRRNVKFLFETNVGAGLPIIHTVNDLVNSGDRVLRIEAVLSGTLNFIFNSLSPTVPFSAAVRMAREQGYSEPDPRVDLSGMDVMRKLLILSRESGYVAEMSDIESKGFIPSEFFEMDEEEFWRSLPGLDEEFEKKRRVLADKGLRWRFVASMENGRYSVQLREISPEHPFYYLEASNNAVLLTTERYHEHPMLIQGYGAGADVTAAGVFADIMSVANI